MAIKPILFNTEMVRAILEGKKTCTRRLVKHDVESILNSPYHKKHPEVEDRQIISKLCQPPYQPRDILYVRETFAWSPCWDCGLDTEPGGCSNETDKIYKEKEYGCYMYRASCEDNEYPSADTWHPSIHMPKEAARIWLKVTDVRVERLQEITPDAIKNEGIILNPKEYVGKFDYTSELYFLFQRLWNSTIKKSDLDCYGWNANPWVWVIEFERCEKPEDYLKTDGLRKE